MPGDEWWEAAGRAAYEEAWLGVRAEVSRVSAPAVMWDEEWPLLSPRAAAQWYEDEMEHHEARRRFAAVATAAVENRPWRWPGETVEGDNMAQELVEMVKRGDEAGFRALAGCVMPASEVDECWHGTRARLGLA